MEINMHGTESFSFLLGAKSLSSACSGFPSPPVHIIIIMGARQPMLSTFESRLLQWEMLKRALKVMIKMSGTLKCFTLADSCTPIVP